MHDQWQNPAIHDAIVQTLADLGKTHAGVVADADDVFATYGLSSLETFRALIKLEKTFGIEIGEHPSDFERVRTLAGLKRLIAEKLARRS